MQTHKDEGCLEPFRTSASLGLAQVSDPGQLFMGEAGDGTGSVPTSLAVGVCKGILTWQVTYGLGSLGYRESRRWGRAMDGRRLKTIKSHAGGPTQRCQGPLCVSACPSLAPIT